MYKKIIFAILIIISLTIFISGCAPGSGSSTPQKPAGFFMGIWHGWIAPISLIWGLLINSDIRIYETFNTGWWYDFGFYIAIIGGFGGFALIRRSRKKKE